MEEAILHSDTKITPPVRVGGAGCSLTPPRTLARVAGGVVPKVGGLYSCLSSALCVPPHGTEVPPYMVLPIKSSTAPKFGIKQVA